jgi:hypothetical protein
MGYPQAMFQCDRCHTEYGGIRGLPAGHCPRCRDNGGDGLGVAVSRPGFALSVASPASRGALTVTLSGPATTALTFVGSRACPS